MAHHQEAGPEGNKIEFSRAELDQNSAALIAGLEQLTNRLEHVELEWEDPEVFGAGHFVLYAEAGALAIKEQYTDTDWSDPDRIATAWTWESKARVGLPDGKGSQATHKSGRVASGDYQQLLDLAEGWAVTANTLAESKANRIISPVIPVVERQQRQRLAAVKQTTSGVDDLAERFGTVEFGDHVGARMTCGEADALAQVIAEGGHLEAAARFLAGHSFEDTPDDAHAGLAHWTNPDASGVRTFFEPASVAAGLKYVSAQLLSAPAGVEPKTTSAPSKLTRTTVEGVDSATVEQSGPQVRL